MRFPDVGQPILAADPLSSGSNRLKAGRGQDCPPHDSPESRETRRTSRAMDFSLQKRFYLALGAYALLAVLATFTLDGKFRVGVWIFLGGLTLKTCIAYKAHDL